MRVKEAFKRPQWNETKYAHLVDANRLPPELYLVHNLARVFSILFCEKLAKPVSLM